MIEKKTRSHLPSVTSLVFFPFFFLAATLMRVANVMEVLLSLASEIQDIVVKTVFRIHLVGLSFLIDRPFINGKL